MKSRRRPRPHNPNFNPHHQGGQQHHQQHQGLPVDDFTDDGGEVIEEQPPQQFNEHGQPIPQEPAKVLNITDLKRKSAAELIEMAEAMGLENIARARKQDVVFSLLKAAARRGEQIYGDGVLEILQDGYGFLRGSDSSYVAGPDDIYVSPSQIRRFSLRTGDSVAGRVRSPKDNERYFALLKVDTINFEPPEASKKKVNFENLTPLFPDERYQMERGNGSTEDITARVIDLVAPFGKGQRGLIISPPK